MLRVIFSSHGERAFGKLPREVQERVAEELTDLADDHYWYQRVRKLQGSEDRFRLRIGRWRILFILGNGEIEIMDIFLKKERRDYGRRE